MEFLPGSFPSARARIFLDYTFAFQASGLGFIYFFYCYSLFVMCFVLDRYNFFLVRGDEALDSFFPPFLPSLDKGRIPNDTVFC